MVGFDTSPEFFDTAVNPQYYENIRGVVRNNLIINTGWEGIGLYGSKDAQIYHNTLVNVDNGPGQFHSAIYFGLTYQDWESHAGRPANVNPNIHHNIVSQPSTIVRPMIEIRYSNDLGGMSALMCKPVMNNNCYYIAGKTAVFTDRRPSSTLENAGFSAWQTHISGESSSLEINPALNTDYLPSNQQCTSMGIQFPLTVTTTPTSPSDNQANSGPDKTNPKQQPPPTSQPDKTNLITEEESQNNTNNKNNSNSNQPLILLSLITAVAFSIGTVFLIVRKKNVKSD
jgi:hypothetical protein